MRTWRVMLSLIALLILTSCNNEPIVDPVNDLKNELLVNFIKTYGLIAPQQNWNMATAVHAEVDPSAMGDGMTVEVYDTDPGKGGLLIGKTSNSATLTLNVKKGANTVYAIARRGTSMPIVYGYYQINNGTVKIAGQPNATAGSRADDNRVPVVAAKNKFQWTIACEDLGSTATSDLDFNDIVLGINAVAGEDHTEVEITALAAGGTLPAVVKIGTTEIGEIHDLVKKNTPTTSMVNTTTWSGIGKTTTVQVDPTWDISTNMGGISIVVTRYDNNLNSVEVHAPEPGDAPQMFCISGDWLWPNEHEHITTAYPDFTKWINDVSYTQWVENNTSSKVISWKKAATTVNSLRMIQSHGADWSTGYTETAGRLGKTVKQWDYVPGLVTKSMAVFCEQNIDNPDFSSDITTTLRYVSGYVERAFSDGSFPMNTSGNNGFVKGQLDNIASAKILINMYRLTNNDADKTRYQTAATNIYNYLQTEYPRIQNVNNHEGVDGFFHKAGEYPNQMWLDGLFMGATFMAEYLAQFEPTNTAGWADVVKQFDIIHDKTFNATDNLNYHAWTAAVAADDDLTYEKSFWAYDGSGNYINTAKPGCSRAYWGRGEGWYFAALVDVLSVMPEGTDKNRLLGYFQAVARGLKDCQDPASGVWYQLLKPSNGFVSKTWAYDDSGITGWKNGKTGSYSVTGGKNNYLEASASCMFTYAFLKGIRLGYLDRSTYLTVARRAYKGLMNNFITIDSDEEFHIHHICSSAGLGGGTSLDKIKYYRDGSESYYLNGNDIAETDDEGKAIGPFILASIEWEMGGYE